MDFFFGFVKNIAWVINLNTNRTEQCVTLQFFLSATKPSKVFFGLLLPEGYRLNTILMYDLLQFL
jgi:hypothetical protein